jgi:tRNA pseudouridine38-40 synthase
VHGAGRTDAGVHALGQVASAQVTSAHPVDVVARALNACLPPDIRVTGVEQASDDFHARFSARSKTYRYVIRNAAIVSPFERAYVWHIPDALDRAAMCEAAAAIVGTHDFAAFRSTGSEVKDTTRTITRSEFVGEPDPSTGSGSPRASSRGDKARPTHREESTLLVYEISGGGFLRHMVRAIAGTLVEIGRRQRSASSMSTLLAGASRAEAGATAPPQGLFLVRVEYD